MLLVVRNAALGALAVAVVDLYALAACALRIATGQTEPALSPVDEWRVHRDESLGVIECVKLGKSKAFACAGYTVTDYSNIRRRGRESGTDAISKRADQLAQPICVNVTVETKENYVAHRLHDTFTAASVVPALTALCTVGRIAT